MSFLANYIYYQYQISGFEYLLRLKSLYIIELIISAIFLIIIANEDKKTLHVSWESTGIYFMIMLPAIVSGILSGILQEQWMFYLAGAVFALIMIVYSFKTGRGGADRDISIISIIAYPFQSVLALIPALLISVIRTAKTKTKYPFLVPYAIGFILFGIVQIVLISGILKYGFAMYIIRCLQIGTLVYANPLY